MLLAPQKSDAYLRSKSPGGKILYWGSYPVIFHVNELGSPGLNPPSVLSAIRESFKTWTFPDCTCLAFKDGGNTTSTQLGYDQDKPEDNQNIILFQTENWEHANHAVAVTSTIFQKTDGRIIAFDMELNQVDFKFGLIGQNDRMDIQNTVTHEIGHVIGLDHSDNSRAAMFAEGRPGETSKRALHQDDIDGLCTIYPKNAAGTCEVTNPNPPDSGCGCKTQKNPTLPLSLLLLPLLIVLLRKS